MQKGFAISLILRRARKNIFILITFGVALPEKIERWQKINLIDNIHLTALYSIACDLNSNEGEFGFYKRWRNRLEHGVFSIVKSNNKELQTILDSQFAEFAFENDFIDKTFHLLQLTRSAIYSFVFCARQELIDR